MAFLLAQIVPTGTLLPGTSSVVQLDAWNWEDAAYKTITGYRWDGPENLPAVGEEAVLAQFATAAGSNYDKNVEAA